MKNKILFSILSILGIASILGLSLTSKEESPLPITQSIHLSTSTTTTSTNVVTKEDISLYDWINTAKMDDSITFNHLTYTHEGSRITVTCSNPEEVETLYLYYNLETENSAFIPVRHYGLDFTELTNVNKVVIFNNDPFYCFGTKLKDIPNSFDLYINGYFESLEEYPNIKELYICEVYDTGTSDIDSYNDVHKLASTHITKIHYADWNKPWTSSNRFSNNEIENADGVSISVDFLDEQKIGFSKELFYPHRDYIYQKEYLDVVAYPIYKGTATKVLPSDISYIIDSIPNKVKTFILPSDINVTNYGLFYPETLVIDNVDFNFISLMNAQINTLVFRTHKDDFSFTQMSYVKNIWFAPTETPPTITHLGINEERNAQIEHIYIPNEYKEAYSMLQRDFLNSRITYYNLSDLEDYHYSFQSKNNNVYFVEDKTLSIDTLESYITEMTEGNYTFTTTEALDTQYQAYLETKLEVPTPTPSDNDDFVDESEFINGYQALGSIYYTSSKSIDDILKIASNYILQKDGVRCDEEKEVGFHMDGDTLSTVIKVDGKIVAAVVSKLQKLDTTDYGEFIYLGNVATFNGVLLFDTTSTTSKTPAEIYAYLLNEITNVKTIPTPDFKDFSLTTPSSVDISSSLIHTNGNKYKVEMECLSFDLSEAKDLSNPEIIYKQVISPDDDKEDVESDYAVKTITKIYLPTTLNASGVPSSINKSIITYKGDSYTGNACLHTTTSSNKNDGKDYSILMAGALPDSVWYEHTIPVSILDNSYSVAFALCEDNTIIVILPQSKKITTATLEKDVESFITDVLKISDSNLKLSSNMNLLLTQTYRGSTYKNGNIDVVVSGLSSLLNISEETPTNPTDKDKEDTPNNSTDKDKDKEGDKNQSDVKDEGTSNIFNDFKDNFENNKTFKTMSIILGTILGLVLIYVGYRIIRKIYKWLKK